MFALNIITIELIAVVGLWGSNIIPPTIRTTVPQGHWSGTSDSGLRFHLTIGAGGAVTGSIGDAAIRSGCAFLNTPKAETIHSGRTFASPEFRLSLNLTGPVSLNDDPSYNHFTLYVTLRGNRLVGHGTLESTRDSTQKGPGDSARLRVTGVVLNRVEEDDLQLVSDRAPQSRAQK